LKYYIEKSLSLAVSLGDENFISFVNSEKGRLRGAREYARYQRSTKYRVIWRGEEYSSKPILWYACFLMEQDGNTPPRYSVGFRPDGRGHVNILLNYGVHVCGWRVPTDPMLPVGPDVHRIYFTGEEFSSQDIEDLRTFVWREIAARPNQVQFRDALLAAYDGKCAVTGCEVKQILEAAHIIPFRGGVTDSVNNGLLLRSDIHKLFDAGLIGFDNCRRVVVAPEIKHSMYGELHGRPLKLPNDDNKHPCVCALTDRAKLYGLLPL
jgi:hypothetical protein